MAFKEKKIFQSRKFKDQIFEFFNFRFSVKIIRSPDQLDKIVGRISPVLHRSYIFQQKGIVHKR